MSIQITKGTRLLTFNSITPANFGSQWGKVAVDSPTQVDSQHGLPYIPDSALKGIIQCELELKEKKAQSEKFFGRSDKVSEDSGFNFGKAASLVLGNAYLYMFPFLFLNCKKAFVIPIQHLFYFQRFENIGLEDENLSNILLTILAADETGSVFCTQSLFHGFSTLPLNFLSMAIAPNNLKFLFALLDRLSDSVFVKNNLFIFAGPKTASLMWKQASEQRTQIRMNSKKKVTEDGSLRKIELIPPGCRFASVVSNCGDDSFDLPNQLISAGAWEKIGAGWFWVSKLQSIVLPDDFASENIENSSYDQIDESTIMNKAYKHIFNNNFDTKLKEKMKAAIDNFGTYLQKFGVESALAFELAKAKPNKNASIENRETFAHRWFLARILELRQPVPTEKSPYTELANNGLSLLANPPISDVTKIKIQINWEWLKRYAQVGF